MTRAAGETSQDDKQYLFLSPPLLVCAWWAAGPPRLPLPGLPPGCRAGGVDAKDGVVAMAAFITAAMDHLTLSRKYAVAGRGRAHLLDKPEGAPREVLSESERARIRRATPKPAQGRGRANNDSGNSYRARGSRGGRGRGRGNFRRKGSYNSDRSRSSSSSKGGDRQRKQR